MGKKAPWIVLAAVVWAALGSALHAQVEVDNVPDQMRGSVLLGLDGEVLLGQRVVRPGFSLQAPFLSYFPADRWRLDLTPRISYASSSNYGVGLIPGFRYYYPGRWRNMQFNSGLAVGFDLVERTPVRRNFRGETIAQPRDLYDAYLIPIELEYWSGPGSALSLGLVYGGTFYEGAPEDLDLSLIGGFRWKLR